MNYGFNLLITNINFYTNKIKLRKKALFCDLIMITELNMLPLEYVYHKHWYVQVECI